jgi:hypothetical protein
MYTEENLRPVRQWFNSVGETLNRMEMSDITEPIVRWIQRMRIYLERTIAQLDASLENYYNRPDVIRAREVFLRTLEENKWLYQHFGLEPQVNDFIRKVRMTTWPMIREKIGQTFEKTLKWSQNRWTVWNPQKGEYAFEVYVPFKTPDTPTLKRLSIPLTVASSLRGAIASYLPHDDWSLVDTFNAYKPTSDVSNWVPPFKAHATLTGAQHYVTFDRKFYEFAGESSATCWHVTSSTKHSASSSTMTKLFAVSQ